MNLIVKLVLLSTNQRRRKAFRVSKWLSSLIIPSLCSHHLFLIQFGTPHCKCSFHRLSSYVSGRGIRVNPAPTRSSPECPLHWSVFISSHSVHSGEVKTRGEEQDGRVEDEERWRQAGRGRRNRGEPFSHWTTGIIPPPHHYQLHELKQHSETMHQRWLCLTPLTAWEGKQ